MDSNINYQNLFDRTMIACIDIFLRKSISRRAFQEIDNACMEIPSQCIVDFLKSGFDMADKHCKQDYMSMKFDTMLVRFLCDSLASAEELQVMVLIKYFFSKLFQEYDLTFFILLCDNECSRKANRTIHKKACNFMFSLE